MIYIYCLVDPRDKNVFYVGASVYPHARYKEHTNKWTGHTDRQKLIDSIKKKRKVIGFKILKETNMKHVDFWERFYYEYFKLKGMNLLQNEGQFCYKKRETNKTKTRLNPFV